MRLPPIQLGAGWRIRVEGVRRERSEGARHVRLEDIACPRSEHVRVPVQERESEEAGFLQRPGDQLPPEGEEGLTETHALPSELTLETAARPHAQGVLGEVPHRQREPVLAAVTPVETAH